MLKENRTLGGELRNQLVATVTEMLEKDDRIMVLDADLGGASFFLRFKKSHPDRFVDCGICEANMVGVALSARLYPGGTHHVGFCGPPCVGSAVHLLRLPEQYHQCIWFGSRHLLRF